MNKSFNSTTLRLSPVKALIELQHQANHIKNIIRPRKISSHQNSRQQEKKKVYSSYLDGKFQKSRRQSIQRQNERILKDCVQIYKAKGILQKVEEDSKISQKNAKRTLVNEYKAKQKMELLKKENKHFKEKIQKLKPLIGDKQQWKKHQVFTSEMIGKLRNTARNKMYNNETIMKIAINSQKEKTNYLHLFKTLNFEKRQSESRQDNRKAEVKTTREKRKRRRTLKRKLIAQTLNVQGLNSHNQQDKIIRVQETNSVHQESPEETPSECHQLIKVQDTKSAHQESPEKSHQLIKEKEHNSAHQETPKESHQPSPSNTAIEQVN